MMHHISNLTLGLIRLYIAVADLLVVVIVDKIAQTLQQLLAVSRDKMKFFL